MTVVPLLKMFAPELPALRMVFPRSIALEAKIPPPSLAVLPLSVLLEMLLPPQMPPPPNWTVLWLIVLFVTRPTAEK